MIKRWQTARLEAMMRLRRGVNLTGARQTGKSTLATVVELPQARRYTFDDKAVRAVAESDPHGFVRHRPGESLVIDEAQKVPDILDAIKMVVDADNSSGQYLLTGSSNLRFAKAVRDSLAGRLGRIRLRTLAQGEIAGRGPGFLETAFARGFRDSYPELDKRGVIHLAFLGGYPEPLGYPQADRSRWMRDYLGDLLEKDVRDVTEIRKLPVLRATARWLLAHTAQFVTIDELAARTAVSKATARNYTEALKALYLFDELPAWSRGDYPLLGRRGKWLATDTALVAGVLGWDEEQVYMDPNRGGKLAETWVYQQIAAEADAADGIVLSHYRDGRGHEIDFMVERPDGAVLGIEVKAGQVSPGDFRHLKWFATNTSGIPFTGIVLHSGNQTLRFGEGFWAVPFGALA